MAFKIGDLFWKVKGDTSDVNKSLKDTDTQVDGSASKFSKLQGIVAKAAPWIAAGAAAFAVGKKIFTLGVEAGNAADKLLDLTEITGLNTDTLQELQFIAADAGVNFDGLTGAVQKFTAKIPDLEGTSNVADAFAALDVSLRDSNGEIRDSNDLFPEMIKSLQNVQNTTERNAIAQQLFGRSLADLAPVLGLTNDEFDALREKANDAGAVLGGDAINAANDFRKELDSAKLAVSQAKVALGSQFAPVLSEVVIPIVTTAANIINTLATAIGKLNDLLNEPTDRADQIAQEITFIEAQIKKTETLNMLTADQKKLLTDNYNTRILELQTELRWLATAEQSEKVLAESTKANTEAKVENKEATEESIEATQEFTDTGQALTGQALVPMTDAAREMWKTYGEGVAAAKDETEDLTQSLIDWDAVANTALGSTLSGFANLGATIYAGGDAFTAFGSLALSALAEVLQALGSQLAAQAAVLAFGVIPDIPRAIGAAAASAAAFTASGVIGAAAADVVSTPSTTSTTSAASTGTTSTTSSTSSSSSGSMTLILNVDGKKLAETSANYYNNGIVELNI